jgi:hypothetical protein
MRKERLADKVGNLNFADCVQAALKLESRITAGCMGQRKVEILIAKKSVYNSIENKLRILGLVPSEKEVNMVSEHGKEEQVKRKSPISDSILKKIVECR